jgi:2-acetylphloroglucinol acetyltransferase
LEVAVAGIIGYGAYIPFTRIKVEEIHKVWRNTSLEKLKNVLMVHERAVLQPNEDTITLAVAAAKEALSQSGMEREKIDAIFLGTCTNPYDSRPSVTILSEAIGSSPQFIGADIQFSGKSGTTAIQVCLGLINSGMAKAGLAVASDTINRHTCPGRAYEYTASAGAAAFLLGREEPVAEIMGTISYASDLADFFRVEGERYIQNIGAGGELFPAWEIGFVDHVQHASEALMSQLKLKPQDYRYAVFQQPYGFAPFTVGERLGFTKEQIEPGVVAPMIGDCGAASSLLGLVAVLDRAKKGDKIFLASYGFGAGSDALSLEATSALEAKRRKVPLSTYLLEKKSYVDYATACRLEYKYMQDMSPLYV